MRVCRPQPWTTTSAAFLMTMFSKYLPAPTHTSPPVEGRELIAAWIEENLPVLTTPSPTVQVQQPPQSPPPAGNGVRQSV